MKEMEKLAQDFSPNIVINLLVAYTALHHIWGIQNGISQGKTIVSHQALYI